jgi:cytochrome c oxidase subunit IV
MATHSNSGHSAHGHEAGVHDHGRGHIGRPTYYRIFAALMGLMILTVLAWYVEPMLQFNRVVGIAVAMAIACAKTALIVLYFMHVKVSERITQLYAGAAFVTLAIMVIIMMGDYFARGWPPQVGPLP